MKMNKQNKKVYILVAAVILLAIAITVAAVIALNDLHAAGTPVSGQPAQLVPTHYIAIDIQDHGTITAELYGEAAPITVENFIGLVDRQYFDGLTFHRIIPGFMMQGGAGAEVETIKGEFAQNGVPNPIKHERGVLSMARTVVPDSAGSQFFIMHQAAPHLDGGYAAFGKVISGIEIVDAVCEAANGDANGILSAEAQPVITSIRQIDKP